MATLEDVHAPRLGEAGEGCTTCGAPLAEDQRYCLNCGTRRAEARVPFRDLLVSGKGTGGATAAVRETEFAPVRREEAAPSITPLGAGLGLALLVLALGVGVLIGTAGEDGNQNAKAEPPVINVGEGAGTATNASATSGEGGAETAGEFKSDWPDGKDGYTVSLQTFEKKGTDVAALTKAKEDAVGKGAKEAGLLDSDQYKSLAPGQYVLFSGVFDTRDQANAALGKLGNFADAEVVQVSKDAPKGKDDANLLTGQKEAEVSPQALEEFEATCKKDPEACQKLRRKLPDELTITGDPGKKEKPLPEGELKGSEGGGSI